MTYYKIIRIILDKNNSPLIALSNKHTLYLKSQSFYDIVTNEQYTPLYNHNTGYLVGFTKN